MTAIQLDVHQLQERLASIDVRDVRPLSGGASSLTYVGSMGDERVVVKVAPPGVAPLRNRDVLRQARLMRALQQTPVPVPRVVWEDAGDPPDTPPLFVMTFAEGSSSEPLFDRDCDDDATKVAEAARNAARTLAQVHAIEPADLGLSAEPVVGPVAEVDRWSRLLQTVDAALVPGWEDVAAQLRSREPAGVRIGLVHGDFRLGNLLRSGSRITAVVDWEIWSLGDPRVDLGWFLANCDPATYRRDTPQASWLPSLDELTETYSRTLGREVPDLRWFRALACFKSSATWSLIVKHDRRRAEPDPAVEEVGRQLPGLLDQARQLLG